MNCTVEVKGACRVEWPDLDGVTIHVQILNGRGARFCCWMGCVVHPRSVAQNVGKLTIVDEHEFRAFRDGDRRLREIAYSQVYRGRPFHARIPAGSLWRQGREHGDEQGPEDEAGQAHQGSSQPARRLPVASAIVLYRRTNACRDRDYGKHTYEKGQETSFRGSGSILPHILFLIVSYPFLISLCSIGGSFFPSCEFLFTQAPDPVQFCLRLPLDMLHDLQHIS